MPRRAPPRIVVAGAVAEDRFGGGTRAGGAAAYAARALAALGLRARALVLAGPGACLGAFEGHELAVVRAGTPLRFAHEAADGGERRLRLLARPDRALAAGGLPRGWAAEADALVLGPLLPDDLDAASFAALGVPAVALLAQGLQREVGADGAVRARREPSPALLAACGPGVSVFLSREETAPWPRGAVEALAARCARVVVTRGADGAEAHRAGAPPLPIAAAPARAADTTGAGDAFAAAYAAALAGGADDAEAGAAAAAVAAAAVAAEGPARLPRVGARAALGDRGAAERAAPA